MLKNKRETLGVDVDKVTEETRISADIIDVLERGEYSSMPSYNHAKNFVKNYAVYLKLDMEKVQEAFENECTKEEFNREVKYISAPVTKESTAGHSSLVVKFVIPIVLIAIIAFTGYKVFTSMKTGSAEQGVSAPAAEQPVAEKETVVDTNEVKEVIKSINSNAEQREAVKKTEPAKEAPKAEEPAVKEDKNVSQSAFIQDEKVEPAAALKTAVLNFSDVCWVHIKIDGSEEMDFIAEKGNQRNIEFRDNFVMDIGNAAVVSVAYGERTIAGLGAYKQPVKGLKFTVDENTERLKYTTAK